MTTMHYSDSLDTPRNKAFRTAYATQFKMQPDVYAVQGYDTGLLLAQGLAATKGDILARIIAHTGDHRREVEALLDS